MATRKLKITTPTTGRFFLLGEENPEVKAVWVVFHGYGQSAADFIRNFADLEDEHTIVVAPEGLHRFYPKSSRGEVGASWMTKEERDDDIRANILYLNQILHQLESKTTSDIHLVIVGFSQGAPTAFRWVAQLDRTVSMMVGWGSDIPMDVLSDPLKLDKINKSNTHLVVGTQDKYVTEERLDHHLSQLDSAGCQYDLISFNGGHHIHSETLRFLLKKLEGKMLD